MRCAGENPQCPVDRDPYPVVDKDSGFVWGGLIDSPVSVWAACHADTESHGTINTAAG